MAEKMSAGVLLYRRREGALEVLLAHPGGPFQKRHEANWSIPKGEPSEGEEPIAAAVREFREETGHPIDGATMTPLGSIRQKGGKVVHAWAVAGDLDPETATCNTFEVEWPPRSGRLQRFPEVDRVEWFTPSEARTRIKDAQIPLLERLEELLAGGVETPAGVEPPAAADPAGHIERTETPS